MMAGLEVTGHSGTFTDFPEPISARDFIGWTLVRKSKFEFSVSILRRAWQTRRYGIWLWMLLVTGLVALRNWIHDLAIRALPDRARFRLKVIAFGLKEDPFEDKKSRRCE